MPTATFDISSDNNDASFYVANNVSWANFVSTLHGSVENCDNFGSDNLPFSKTAIGFWYVIAVLLRWDTSLLPADATVGSASLKLYVGSTGNPDLVSYAADFFDYGGSPCTYADWEMTSSGNAISSIPISSLTNNAVNTFTLTGLSGINVGPGAITGIRLAPLNNTEPTGDNFADIAGFASANPAPQLVVDYTTTAADTQTRRYQIRRSRMTSW